MKSSVVHLELHTHDLLGAGDFYERLCGWRPEPIAVPGGSYLALALGGALDGGIVECRTRRPRWLPYVEVEDVTAATGLARSLGAAVLLEPREGPHGWRAVVSAPATGELAFWQAKRARQAAGARR